MHCSLCELKPPLTKNSASLSQVYARFGESGKSGDGVFKNRVLVTSRYWKDYAEDYTASFNAVFGVYEKGNPFGYRTGLLLLWKG